MVKTEFGTIEKFRSARSASNFTNFLVSLCGIKIQKYKRSFKNIKYNHVLYFVRSFFYAELRLKTEKELTKSFKELISLF